MKTHSTYSQMTLERFRPNRRRGWKRKLGCWLWTVLWMLAVWALLWWSFSALSGARPTTGSFTPPRLEGSGVEVAIGIVLIVVTGLLARLVNGRKRERHEAWVAAQKMNCPHCGSGLLWGDDRGAHCDGCDDFDPETDIEGLMPVMPRGVDWTNGARTNAWDDDPFNADGGVRAPREAMPEGLTRLDAALIVHACASRVGLIRSIVQGAQRPITDEDQAEALATAERLLGDLRVTLFELRGKFQEKAAISSSQGLPVSPSSTGEANG